MQELCIISRAWCQAWLQLRVVNREALPWLGQWIVIQARGLAGVYLTAQLLQLFTAEELLEHCTTSVAGTTYQPAVTCTWQHISTHA